MGKRYELMVPPLAIGSHGARELVGNAIPMGDLTGQTVILNFHDCLVETAHFIDEAVRQVCVHRHARLIMNNMTSGASEAAWIAAERYEVQLLLKVSVPVVQRTTFG